MKMPRYIDPLSEFGFMKIFGSASSKGLLIAFLNVIFEGKRQIKDVQYNSNGHIESINIDGEVFFEITCLDEYEVQFTVMIRVNKKQTLGR